MSQYYKTCPYCGANLDPDERCDCLDEPTVDDMQQAADLEQWNK